jgi:prepilin-type N-terminal cleavage/methylation domain-containing protein
MTTRRSGFSLAELLVVIVLASILMGAAYQSLFVQERTFRTTGDMIRSQDALRTALGVLEAELREAVTVPSATGGPDILLATRDSVVFRAQRRLGFVCEVASNEKHLVTWSLSAVDFFTTADSVVFVFADGVVTTADDDRWIALRPSGVQASTAACPSRPGTQVADQRLVSLKAEDGSDVSPQVLEDVHPGAPVRGVQRVTYGIYESGGRWMMARRAGSGGPERLVSGLAEPGEGLVFTYLDGDGNQLIDPVTPGSVAAIRVVMRSAPAPGTRTHPMELTTQIHLRNN